MTLRADVVAERHRAEKVFAASTPVLRRRKRRRHDRRRPGCDCDAQCESSVSSECASTPLTSAASIGPVNNGRADDRGRLAVPACARASASAASPRRQLRPGNHRRERVEDVVLGLLDDVRRQRPSFAAAMYALSDAMTGLIACARSLTNGRAAVESVSAPRRSRSRREIRESQKRVISREV